MILTDLFTDFVDFRQCVPGIESNVSFKDLTPSAINAYKRICNLISVKVYDSLVDQHDSDPAKSQFDYLRMAMANLTAKQQQVFDALSKRKAGMEVYKYELEAMNRSYADNYFAAMDSLLQSLIDDNNAEFAETDICKILSTLPIKSTSAFDMLYQIDCSYIFFFRCISLQREIYTKYLKITYDKISASTSLSSEEKAQRTDDLNAILAKWTVSLALSRFDILEFPSVIRDYFSESKKPSEISPTKELSDSLKNECQQDLDTINMQLTDNTSFSVNTQTSFNQPGDKIILMP